MQLRFNLALLALLSTSAGVGSKSHRTKRHDGGYLSQLIKTAPWDDTRYYQLAARGAEYEGDLDCDVDNPCCWQNAKPGADQLEFAVGLAPVEPSLFETAMGTSEQPSSRFLYVASLSAEHPYFEAHLTSCAIICTDRPVAVSLKHWRTEGAELEVCARETFFDHAEMAPLIHCHRIPPSESPGPSLVFLPPGEIFEVVLVARSFTNAQGGMVLVDDVRVDFNNCPNEPIMVTPDAPLPTPPPTTPAPTTELVTEEFYYYDETTQTPGTECADIVCDFEMSDTCLYYDDFSVDSRFGTNKGYEVLSGRFKNPVTGIRSAAQGDFYVGTYLKPDETAALVVETFFTRDLVVRFHGYEATKSLNLRLCCDSDAFCPFGTDEDVTQTDRYWKETSVICPEGTEKLVFICANVGKLQGACGVDDIRLFEANGADAEAATEQLCLGGQYAKSFVRRR